MLDKILMTIIALMATALTINKIESKKSMEGFLGNLPSMKTKVWRGLGSEAGDFYSVPGQYQSMLAPRNNGNIDYGANIRYNIPAYGNMAVPRDPLAMSDMASNAPFNMRRTMAAPTASAPPMMASPPPPPVMSESFQPPNTTSLAFMNSIPTAPGYALPPAPKYAPGYAQTMPNASGIGYGVQMPSSGPAPGFSNSIPAGFAAGNFNEVTASAKSPFPAGVSQLPVGTTTTINAAGEVIQPVVYDRFVYANRNSRLRSQCDPIRGDLPIVPCSASWFRPSVHPQLDLQEGAMNVMGGFANSTSRSLAQLIDLASAGTTTTIGGINMPAGMAFQSAPLGMASNSYSTSLGAGNTDIITTAYP